MKKLICILLALCLMLALAACGGKDDAAANNNQADSNVQADNSNDNNNDAAQDNAGDDQPAVEDNNAPAEAGFVFTYNGTDISMNAPAADILAALGEPKSQTEEPSCAFDGMDKTYYYGSFYLQTYPMTDGDYIYCLWMVDDSVNTAEGIYIGAPEAQVEAAYGAENYNGSNAYVVTKGDSKLTVIIDGGVVSSIQYDAIVF